MPGLPLSLLFGVLLAGLLLTVWKRAAATARRLPQRSPPSLCDMGVPDFVGVPPIRTATGMLDGVRMRVQVIEGDGDGGTEDDAGLDALLVHGACSDGATWARVLRDPWWRRTFARILVVDLPGYGASTVGSMPHRSADVQASFARAIAHVLEALSDPGASPSRKVVVVAHSMGAVLTAPLTCPQLGRRVAGFLWLCPIGALPTLGVLGAWWSLVFEFGFPHKQLHAMGPRMAGLVLRLLGMERLHSLSSPTATGYRAPQTFVGKSSLGRNFEDPWLYRTCRRLQASSTVPPPIVLVSGGRDSLVPPHLAEMTRRGLARYRPDLPNAHIVVPGAGHSLESFSEADLRGACGRLLGLGPADGNQPASPRTTPRTPTSFPDVGYMTSFSISRTRRAIARFYAALLDPAPRSAPGPGPHLPHDEAEPVKVEPPEPDQQAAEREERDAV
jgi:pimeloyl-ACP methyl ester carboxylesterase